jgi:DNA helicase II / ATP-dependent DNA helicase PcrA
VTATVDVRAALHAADVPMRYSAAAIAEALGNPPPTPEQVAVIEAPMRPLLVVAGAGSGKTETMASRVVWLVANGHVEPDQVLGLTFTRKAATELAERIGRRLRRLRHVGMWQPALEDDGAEVLGGTPTVSTYHSYAGRLVREHALRLGVEPDARLLSEAAAWQYANEVVERHDGPMEDVDFAPATVTNAVVSLAGEMAEHLLEPEAVERLLEQVVDRIEQLPVTGRSRPREVADLLRALKARRQVVPLVRAYLELKRRRDALDFADQMALAARLARRFPDLGDMERQRFRAVLLDEFQDTSEAQMVLLHALFGAGDHAVPVTAVGDPHQSIYGWRGASATTLSRFPGMFSVHGHPADVLPLSTSWRNDTVLLDAANLTSAPLRLGSSVDVQLLRARPGAGPGSLTAARLETLEDEAAHVAGWIGEHWFAAGDRHTGVSAAVLCRKRSQFPAVLDALKARGLPVEVVGLGGLLSTPEVADIVALLWVVQDPSRGDHLMRLLTGPMCRLGPADLDGLAAWARHLQRRHQPSSAVKDQAPDSSDRASIVEALDELPPRGWRGREGQYVSEVGLERLAGLAETVRRLRALTGLSLADLTGEAERALGLDIEVLARPEYLPGSARAQLDAFADVAAGFSTSADRPTLGGFLSWLAAAVQEERGLDKGLVEVSSDAVQVLTVHAAKGLEWDVVAVPGLTEGTFPAHSASTTRWNEEQWVTGAPKDKGWCGGLDGVPYPLRGDRDGLPDFGWRTPQDASEAKEELDRFALAGGEHAIAEERRLAYVAFTRARHHLLLTAPVWADATTPRITSRFLTALLDEPALGVEVTQWSPMPEPGENGKAANPRQLEPANASWPAVDPSNHRRQQHLDAHQAVLDAIRARPGQQQRDATQLALPLGDDAPSGAVSRAEEIRILLEERRRAREAREQVVELPRHLSASAVVALAEDRNRFVRDLRRPVPMAPATAARRGTAFHAWVEQHYGRAAFVDVLELPGSADVDAAADEDLPRLKANFLASEWAHRQPDAIEIAIETVVGGIAVRGRIDAVFPRPEGGFTVVDWKTGARPTGQAAEVRAIQLGAYRLAFARLRGLALEDVDGAFYYASSGETVWPDLPGEPELVELLSRAAD